MCVIRMLCLLSQVFWDKNFKKTRNAGLELALWRHQRHFACDVVSVDGTSTEPARG